MNIPRAPLVDHLARTAQRDADHDYYTTGEGYRAIRREVMREVVKMFGMFEYLPEGSRLFSYQSVIRKLRAEAEKP